MLRLIRDKADKSPGFGNRSNNCSQRGDYVHLRLPSGEVRKILSKGLATVGNIGNIEWKNRFSKKPVQKYTWESGRRLEELPKIREAILTEEEKEGQESE